MLSPEATDVASAMGAIRAASAFTPGDPSGICWPLALEAEDAESSERWCDWLRRLPGVEGVEVVFVHWDEVESGVSHVGA